MAIFDERIKKLLAVVEKAGTFCLFKDGSLGPVTPTNDFSNIEAIIEADDAKKRLINELFGKSIPKEEEYKMMILLMRLVHKETDVSNKLLIQRKLHTTFADRIVPLRKVSSEKKENDKKKIEGKKVDEKKNIPPTPAKK